MSVGISGFTTWSAVDETTLDDYIEERYETYLWFSKMARTQEKLSQEVYEDLILQVVEAVTWGEGFDQMQQLFNNLKESIDDNDYFTLLKRITKGAEKIETETDPVKKAEYMKLYDVLYEKARRYRRIETHGYDYEEGVK
jgi:hypothetical protein